MLAPINGNIVFLIYPRNRLASNSENNSQFSVELDVKWTRVEKLKHFCFNSIW